MQRAIKDGGVRSNVAPVADGVSMAALMVRPSIAETNLTLYKVESSLIEDFFDALATHSWRKLLRCGLDVAMNVSPLTRALVAFVVLPGTVSLLVPYLLAPRNEAFYTVALAPLLIGLALLLWCVRDFYVSGKGTLAPWSPPDKLVRVGLYRYSRNPMYIAVLLMLVGWAGGYGSQILWLYTFSVMVGFHLRIVFYEEPLLARTYGEDWTRYKASVPRWLF